MTNRPTRIKPDYVDSQSVTHWTAILNHNFRVPKFVRVSFPVVLVLIAPVFVVFIGELFGV